MAKLSHERASSKASSLISTINLIVIALELIVSQQRQADAFPLLFNRPSIFRRTNQQQQAKQQQQQQIQQQQQQQFANQPVELIPLANSQVPILNRAPVQSVNLQQYVQAGQLHPAELMRLSSIHQQIGAQPLHHLANQQQQQQQQAASNTNGATSSVLSMSSNINANMDSAAQAAAYYKPNIVQPSSFSSTEHQQQQQQQNFDAIQPTSFDLYDNAQPDYLTKVQSIGNAASQSTQQQLLKSASSSGDNSGQGMHLEPTHTSEVVDKIEEHIGRQIEQSLGESDHQQHFFNQPSFRQAAASGYHEQAAAKAAEAEEKSEAASSGGEGGESSESSGGGGGEESGAEEKAEKREEHEHKHHEPKEVKEEHHQHVEHPPEAFEVHHKKGGKSFQYFHQGHHQ